MRFYNTLARDYQNFKPMNEDEVKIYTCGLTVYSHPHIGNWVSYIYWDVLVRVLKLSGYNVKRAQNITDVGHLVSDDDEGEDKMEKGAKAEGLNAWQVADKYIDIADQEAKQLGLLKPDILLRATDLIDEQIEFVKDLEEKGFLYTIENDGLYFDTSKLSGYGKLARLDIKGLKAGIRVSVKGKKNITDFAVWKFSPKNTKRDMEWESPWGKGFPGWHLECSVIAKQALGEQLDIHTGGVDHIPVHHTNEIAQTEAVTGKQFANYWLHNEHLKIDNGKMSKSLGNVYLLSDLSDKGYSLMAFKLMILSKHYRTEGNFTFEILEAAQNRLKNYQALADLRWQTKKVGLTTPDIQKVWSDILNDIQSDLNTPEALAKLSDFEAKAQDELIASTAETEFKHFIAKLDELFGLNFNSSKDITNDQKKLIQKRDEIRKSGDWAKSDEIRDALKEQGIKLRDTSQGAIWSRA